jgi:hypothetical protein
LEFKSVAAKSDIPGEGLLGGGVRGGGGPGGVLQGAGHLGGGLGDDAGDADAMLEAAMGGMPQTVGSVVDGFKAMGLHAGAAAAAAAEAAAAAQGAAQASSNLVVAASAPALDPLGTVTPSPPGPPQQMAIAHWNT